MNRLSDPKISSEDETRLRRMMDDDIACLVKNDTLYANDVDVPSIRIMHEIDRQITRHRRLKVTAIVAAAIVPIVALCMFALAQALDWGYTPTVRTISVSEGEQMTVLLSDGTSVMLNSATTLRYPERFSRRSRQVELTAGEAFFDVKHNDKAPFTVNAETVSIEVYGTKFNVNTYGDYNTTNVYLKEGSIRLTENVSGRRNSFVMRPGDIMSVNKGSGVCHSDRAQNNTKIDGWIHRNYCFTNAPLADMLRFLERQYNVVFRVSDIALYQYSYNIEFYNETIDEVLTTMSAITPIRYTRINNEISLYPEN